MKAWLAMVTVGAGLALAGCHSDPLAEGQREMAAGNYAQAAQTFSALRDQHPEDPRVHNELGLAYAKQEKNDEARAAYQKAIQLDPAFPEAHFNLGTLYLRLNEVVEAQAELRLAVKNRPDYVKAYNNLGLALMAIGEFGEAETNFKKAIELAPNEAVYRENLQYSQDLAKSTKEHVQGLAEEKRKEAGPAPGGKPSPPEAQPTAPAPAAPPEKAPAAPAP